jgi:PAS domain S-box-containing protein
MTWHYPTYALVLLLGTALAIAVAVIACTRRNIPGTQALALLMLAVAEWAFLSILELADPDLQRKIMWAKLQYVGIVAVPVLWLLFVLAYIPHRPSLRPVHVAVLSMIPAVTLCLVATNEQHRLIWSRILPPLNAGAAPTYGHGPWFWVTVFYGYLLVLAGVVWLARAAARAGPGPRRRKAATVLVGAVIPWIANVLYQAGLGPVPGLDLTPFAFGLTGLVGSWSIFRFELLDPVPVARSVLLNSMSDGVAVLDTRDRVVEINPAGQALLGGIAPMRDGIEGDGVEQGTLAALQRIIERYSGLREARDEIRIETGQARFLDLRISPLYDDRGRFTGRLVVLRDITEHKQADAVLLEAKLAAEAASRSKSAFLSNVSHELRTPLNAILGFVNLLRTDDNLSGDQRQSLDLIARSSESLLGLITDLLDLARVEAGRMVLNEHEFDLYRLLDGLREMFRLRAAARSLVLTFEAAPGLPRWVCADEGKLRQVLINLLGNAIKFTETGEIRLAVDCGLVEPASAAGACDLHFAVRDTGIGIAQEDLAVIFDPFVQAARGRQTHEGTGLGLSISREFVRLMGGELRVESTPGHGSTFSFAVTARLVASPPSQSDGGEALEADEPLYRPDSAALSRLPAGWLAALEQAVVQSDLDQILGLVEPIAGHDARLAAVVRDLANNFEYRQILDLMHRKEERNHASHE